MIKQNCCLVIYHSLAVKPEQQVYWRQIHKNNNTNNKPYHPTVNTQATGKHIQIAVVINFYVQGALAHLPATEYNSTHKLCYSTSTLINFHGNASDIR